MQSRNAIQRLFFIILVINTCLYAERYSLITTLTHEKNQDKVKTYLECLEKNFKNKLIDDIHIIYDFSNDDNDNALLKELERLPFTIHFHHENPTYELCFRIAHSFCKNSRIIISNPDTYFNQTLGLLSSINLQELFINIGQDALIFQTPLPVMAKTEIYLDESNSVELITAQAAQTKLLLSSSLRIEACHPSSFDISKRNTKQVAARHPSKNYRVSLIASLFNNNEFIQDFMKNMVEQSIFSSTELIIINAASMGNEEPVIMPYLRKYSNIKYIRLPHDPGLYAVWNLGIKYANAPLIGNANLDDRRELSSLEIHVKMLEEQPEYDLVYSDFFITRTANDQWYNIAHYPCTCAPANIDQDINYCIPGIQPVWRKSMHEKHGFFKEDFVSAADYEMWCRAIEGGSRFIKCNVPSGLYYLNPKGVSTNPNSPGSKEDYYIRYRYQYLWS